MFLNKFIEYFEQHNVQLIKLKNNIKPNIWIFYQSFDESRNILIRVLSLRFWLELFLFNIYLIFIILNLNKLN